MSVFVSHSPDETEALAETIAAKLCAGDMVALYGGLGMGKTAFVRGLARGLGSSDAVSSPTFALVHEYDGRMPIYHFDMYRIRTLDDLYSTGFFDYLESGGVVVTEWTENIEDYLPQNVIEIHIERGVQENERRLTIHENIGG